MMKYLLSFIAISVLLVGCGGGGNDKDVGGGGGEEPAVWGQSTWDSTARWQ